MKLFEEIDADVVSTERYSLYHLNRADNFLIKNSLKFFLLNTSKDQLENTLKQYQLLKSIDIIPTIFTPNIEFFTSNHISEKEIIETNSYSFLANYNEIIKNCNSNYVFFITSNIILDNIDEIVNRFYLTYQNFSTKLGCWSVKVNRDFPLKIYPDYKVENNIFFVPYLSLEFFCLKTEYLRKIGLLSFIKDNEDCFGFEYLLYWLINQNEDYLIADLNYSLELLEDRISKVENIQEKQFKFFDIHKKIYNLNEVFYGYWYANVPEGLNFAQPNS